MTPRPTTIGPDTRVKWLLFRLLERLSSLRSGQSGVSERHPGQGASPCMNPRNATGSRALWIYVSTIGELNAIEPFLRKVISEMDAPPVVLLTDHPHYRESFLAKFPGSRVCALDHRSETAAGLAASVTPRLLVLAEIPCMLSDAPCRFPFAVVYEVKRRGVPVCMVNGWLYGQPPSCTMDAIERRLFGREYLRLLDLITVQNDATRETLVAHGADPQRVFVTGNIKFDAITTPAWDPGQTKSPVLLGSIVASGRPTIVAGCVTNISEQTLALDAYASVLRQLPDSLLVLAPRHPEVKERMEKLRALLAARKLNYALKSESGDVPVAADLNCLVLDTMGELKNFYAAGTFAYVGLNHNVLEPLSFGKPVVVTPGWDPIYPSFPVYKHLLAQRALVQVENDDLGNAWLDLLCNPLAYCSQQEQSDSVLESLKGATSRNLALLERFGLLQKAA